MNKFQIMNQVDILDLIRIHVLGPFQELDPLTGKEGARFEVSFEALDNAKSLVFDPDALQTLNGEITRRMRDYQALDPRAKYYIEEFVARMISGLYKNGLVEIVESQETPEDHYAEIRNKYGN